MYKVLCGWIVHRFVIFVLIWESCDFTISHETSHLDFAQKYMLAYSRIVVWCINRGSNHYNFSVQN